MATATKRTTAPARSAARPSSSGGSKAQRAAAEQGRNARPSSGRTVPAEPKRSNVPALQNKGNTDLAGYDVSNLPAHLRQDVGRGMENIGREDVETPRLKLMQGLSKELQEYNELRAGMFFHTSGEHIFDGPFLGVPIYMDKQYILWRPRDSGGGIIARAADGVHWSPSSGIYEVQLDKKDGGAKVKWELAPTVAQSGLGQWGTMNPDDPDSPPAATMMYNYVIGFPEHPELMPAALTFQRSSLKMGKRFNTKLLTRGPAIYGRVFEFSSVSDSNTRGQDFFNVNVVGAGVVEDPDLYEQYKQMHEQLAGTGLRIKDIEELGDEDPAALNAADAANDRSGQKGRARF